MNGYTDTLYTIIITLVAVVGLPLIAHLIVSLSAFLRQEAGEIKNEQAQSLVLQAISIVEQAVLYVMQTYVDGLKRAGSFDKEAQKNALINARAKAKALINGDMVKAIEDGYGSFDTWLDTRIEQTVRETKK